MGLHNTTIEELGALLETLELDRLNLVEAVADNESYNNDDLAKLALHGAAVQCVRDAIAYRKDFDAR